jgi:hypothetical protein
MLKIPSFTAGAAKACIDNKRVMASALHLKQEIAFAGGERGHFSGVVSRRARLSRKRHWNGI